MYRDVVSDMSGMIVSLMILKLRWFVTMIIYNAWQLNFNLILSSLESHIQGTRRLIDLEFSSPHVEHIRVLFTSSIAVSASWPRDQGAFPEEPQEDAKWSIGAGYGEGKYVAERVGYLPLLTYDSS